MRVLYIILLSLLTISLSAQPNVNLCLENTGTALELKIQPDAAFSGFVANVQFTIKVDDPSVTFGLPTAILTYIPMAKAGSEASFGGSTYQKFAGFGTLPLSSFASSWAAGDVITLFSIVPSDLSANYSLAVDSWATDNNGEYYIELDAIDKSGTVSVCSSTLPVAGLKLEAKIASQTSVQLDWQTLSELGNDHFLVEKSRDHAPFEVLATVKAVGHSDQANMYQFEDQSQMGHFNRYRIRQVDNDGRYTFSNVQTIEWEQDYVGNLFPNPSRERFYLALGLANDTEVQLRLYNAVGQMVQRVERSAEPGSQEISIDIKDIAPGVYTLAIILNGKKQSSQRLIIQ